MNSGRPHIVLDHPLAACIRGLALAIALVVSHANAEGLLDLYNEALAHDPALQSAQALYNAQLMKYPEARAKWLPGVRLSGETLHGHINQQNSVFPDYNSNGYTVSLSQTLFDWSALQDLNESEIVVEQAVLDLAKAENDLVLRLTTAFFDVLVAQEEMKVSDQHIETLKEQLALANASFAAGHGTVVDVRDAQANLDAAQADKLQFASNLRTKLARLSSIVGHPVASVAPLPGEMPVRPDIYPEAEAAWTERAKSDNLNVRIQALTISHAEHETSRYRYSSLPVVTLNAAYSRGNANYINGQDNFVTGGPSAKSARIGIQVTIPLVDGMLARSQLQESLALEDKARADLSVSEQQASLDAQQAFLSAHGSFARANALYSATSSARLALVSNQKAYQAGIRLNSDVLTAAGKVFDDERDLTQARVDALLWSLKLKNAVGELSISDVAALDALLTRPAPTPPATLPPGVGQASPAHADAHAS